MRGRGLSGWGIGLATAFVVGMPASAGACATCFGASDSAMAQGMNLGILSLLGIIGVVLFGLICFFAFLAWRASRTTEPDLTEGHLMFPDSTSAK